MSSGCATPSEDSDGLLPAETHRLYLDVQDDTSVDEDEMGCERHELILPLNSQSSVRDTARLPHMDSLVTVPTVRYIQPAQRSPSCDQQLTNSDEELLHACELFDALQNPTSSTKRDCNPESIYFDLPLENVSMHNLAPEPPMQNYEEALTLTVEEWARRTVQANANS